MCKDFTLLIKLNMPAHYNNRLPHQKHEKSTKQRKNKNGNTTKSNHAPYRKWCIDYFVNKNIYQYIIFFFRSNKGFSGQGLLYIVNYKAGNLGRQNTEIIRNNDKENTDTEAKTVFPEIFIEGFQVFQ